MATMDDMDKFVNWDNPELVMEDDHQFALQDVDAAFAGMDTDLVFENINEDDFSFNALQHFTDQHMAANGMDIPAPVPDAVHEPTVHASFWETPAVPCSQCSLGGYSCKKIREGRHKGYCTSCVALTLECSFGGEVPANLNPKFVSVPAASMTGLDSDLSAILDEAAMYNRDTTATADLLSITNAVSDGPVLVAPRPQAPPAKIGARFSRESVRILKTWLTTHNRHPYPSDEEKEMLQRNTGLSKTQITNWLANARRRGKVQPPRSTSPQVGNWSSSGIGSIDIPKRRGTPALETMNPLQRWEHSPPENEPASVTAIARAVTASSSGLSSGLNSPFSTVNYTDDGSSRSLCNQSSVSSLGTSQSSNGSRGSAYSYASRNSFGSARFSNHGRRRRRRRPTPNQSQEEKGKGIKSAPRTFQCTFCTETFRTKHDWQRHEKSLHLSLERWVCAPHGSRAVNPETGLLSCVYCGIVDPDESHIESHNHSTCQEKSAAERTFYRKDHLNQHLRLVHNVKFADWSMKSWKVAAPEIRSRCGFCGIVMDTWTIRVDHLAEHFKTGYSMADWKGDWGFDSSVLDMVENSVPPYLIHHERNSPLPYVASQPSPQSPRNAYELIKLELEYFTANYLEQNGTHPTDEELMVEGCRIIYASELLSLQGIASEVSWLRDVIMKMEELALKARFGPLRGATENRLATLKINGKDNLFELCPLEFQLQEFVRAKRLLGLTAMDYELQQEACRIVGRVEEVSVHPSDIVANWLLRLIRSSTHWLADFRRRAHLPRTEDVKNDTCRSNDPTVIDSTIHSYTRLESELRDFLRDQRALGLEPTDEDLQRQARIIIYEFDDGWNQTAADNALWLRAFKERHLHDLSPAGTETSPGLSLTKTHPSTTTDTPITLHSPDAVRAAPKALDVNGNLLKLTPFFLNDANCYRRLSKELGRWVAATMSPNNPNQHVPSDEELRHQARYIIYESDDPWNQTAADNVEWLQRFKRDSGIIHDAGPGLPECSAWAVEQGGSGFAPPYTFPKSQLEPFSGDVQISMRAGTKPFSAGQSGANGFLENLTSRDQRPAAIFCSRELERRLLEFTRNSVVDTGRLPSGDSLRRYAREVMRTDTTPVDDPVLLTKFQEWIVQKCPGVELAEPETETSCLPKNMDVNISDEDLEYMLQDMDFDFGSGQYDRAVESDGGVSLIGFND
ncbi:unnamed protein product [Clonostachys rhizophaga]|uniref:Uncharacterized protein n=1 Tax=Clonostachys rhizophaga TaxID=160324 RepID=A0A9N9VE96_9HYPO|nr:unnamed protein product [Clonostachys rhizophaga]